MGKKNGVEIEYVEETLPKSFESELVEDVMSFMTVLLLNCIVEESVNLKNIGRNKKKNENSK